MALKGATKKQKETADSSGKQQSNPNAEDGSAGATAYNGESGVSEQKERPNGNYISFLSFISSCFDGKFLFSYHMPMLPRCLYPVNSEAQPC